MAGPRREETDDASAQQGLTIILATLGALVPLPAAGAQDYPDQADHPDRAVAGRRLDRHLDARDRRQRVEDLGQPIVIDNKAGGGGTVGPATMAATAKPDGYTISQIPITVFRLPLMQKSRGIPPTTSATSSISPATPSASPPMPSRSSRPGRTSSISPRPIPAR